MYRNLPPPEAACRLVFRCRWFQPQHLTSGTQSDTLVIGRWLWGECVWMCMRRISSVSEYIEHCQALSMRRASATSSVESSTSFHPFIVAVAHNPMRWNRDGMMQAPVCSFPFNGPTLAERSSAQKLQLDLADMTWHFLTDGCQGNIRSRKLNTSTACSCVLIQIYCWNSPERVKEAERRWDRSFHDDNACICWPSFLILSKFKILKQIWTPVAQGWLKSDFCTPTRNTFRIKFGIALTVCLLTFISIDAMMNAHRPVN